MAGRIRSIKPEFIEDEKLCAMDSRTRLVFACLWLLADDYGNLRASPSWIHGQVFHSDPRETVENVRESLANLSRAGMLTQYRVRGQAYYHVTNWHRHQRVDKPGKPRVPGPKEADSIGAREDSRDSRECGASDSGVARGTLAPDQDQDQEEEIPPTPQRPRDPFGDSFRGGPAGRQDVQEVFEAWKLACGYPNARFRGSTDLNAGTIAEAIDAYGLESCLLVAEHAPHDGMVDGSLDEKRQKHDTVAYVFGNPGAFDRILRAAQEVAGKTRRNRSPSELHAEAIGQ